MRVSYNKCDHCGKRLDDHTDYVEVDIDIKNLRCADLCSDCFEELDRIVETLLRKRCMRRSKGNAGRIGKD